jgi:hypothetical protein
MWENTNVGGNVNENFPHFYFSTFLPKNKNVYGNVYGNFP